MDASTSPAPSAPASHSMHRWIARIGSSLWLFVLLGVMLAKDRFEPLLLVALGVPFLVLYVAFERIAASPRWRMLASGVLLTGVGFLLAWADVLIGWRPDWRELLMPDVGSRTEAMQFTRAGGWIALTGVALTAVLALASTSRTRT